MEKGKSHKCIGNFLILGCRGADRSPVAPGTAPDCVMYDCVMYVCWASSALLRSSVYHLSHFESMECLVLNTCILNKCLEHFWVLCKHQLDSVILKRGILSLKSLRDRLGQGANGSGVGNEPQGKDSSAPLNHTMTHSQDRTALGEKSPDSRQK